MRHKKTIATLLLFVDCMSAWAAPQAKSASEDVVHTRPTNVTPRSSAEYYSTSPESRMLIPVNIWGNVREPGVHYVPIGSSLMQSVSAAGGPSENADFSNVRLLQGNKHTYADLLKTSGPVVQANDTIYVQKSYKADLPLIFSGIATIVSIVTLYYVVKQNND